MPEFEGAEGFPSPADDLPRVAFASLGKLIFASLAPGLPVRGAGRGDDGARRVAPDRAMPCSTRPARATTTCPRTGRSTATTTSKGSTSRSCTPRLARSARLRRVPDRALPVGEPPGRSGARRRRRVRASRASSPDHGRRDRRLLLLALPRTMINVYPWGLSVNVVQPLALDRTRVSFLTYVWDAEALGRGAGADLDRVEREDEAVVESVQRGVRSRLYRRGRYSPTHERGVHHFHRLLTRFLAAEMTSARGGKRSASSGGLGVRRDPAHDRLGRRERHLPDDGQRRERRAAPGPRSSWSGCSAGSSRSPAR